MTRKKGENQRNPCYFDLLRVVSEQQTLLIYNHVKQSEKTLKQGPSTFERFWDQINVYVASHSGVR